MADGTKTSRGRHVRVWERSEHPPRTDGAARAHERLGRKAPPSNGRDSTSHRSQEWTDRWTRQDVGAERRQWRQAGQGAGEGVTRGCGPGHAELPPQQVRLASSLLPGQVWHQPAHPQGRPKAVAAHCRAHPMSLEGPLGVNGIAGVSTLTLLASQDREARVTTTATPAATEGSESDSLVVRHPRGTQLPDLLMLWRPPARLPTRTHHHSRSKRSDPRVQRTPVTRVLQGATPLWTWRGEVCRNRGEGKFSLSLKNVFHVTVGFYCSGSTSNRALWPRCGMLGAHWK